MSRVTETCQRIETLMPQSRLSLTPTLMEQCISGRPTTNNLHTHYLLSIFPTNTKLVGPVIVLQRKQGQAMVYLSNKLLLPDGTEVVISVECRQLWAGHDGVAFDAKPNSNWRIAASSRNGLILNHGIL